MLNKLVEASLRYKFLVIIFFLVVGFLGWRAVSTIPIDAFPDVTPVQVNIYTESPGLAAEDVEPAARVVAHGVDDADVPIGDPTVDHLDRGKHIRSRRDDLVEAVFPVVEIVFEDEGDLGLGPRLHEASRGDRGAVATE